MPLRTLILGGTGNFGARLVRALCNDPDFEIIAAARHPKPIDGAPAVPTVPLDLRQGNLEAQFRKLAPRLVLHCAGPFQDQDYRVARAALGVRAHYIDLADGRRFVADFPAQNEAFARAQGRSAMAGASTLPALSGAVVDELVQGLDRLESIDIAIAPGQRASRGVATFGGVFSYLGEPISVWQRGRWRRRYGWAHLARVPLRIGHRVGALCDVPDLELFPQRYPGVRSVMFRAALEFKVQHYALWLLSLLKRLGMPLAPDRWAVRLNAVAPWFDRFAGEFGAMRVSVVGGRSGERVRRTWELKVPAHDGPEIPCLAALLLARRLARGDELPAGAYTALGQFALADFAESFSRWNIVTSVVEDKL